MRSLLPYSGSRITPAGLIYLTHQERVELDGGTMYNNAVCTTTKIASLLSFPTTVEQDIYINYLKRVSIDGGAIYQASSCTINKIKTLNS